MHMRKPMSDKEFSLFFTPIVSAAHLHGIDSSEAKYGVIGFVKSIKAAGPETKKWVIDGINSKLKAIAGKQTDFHMDMKITLDRILQELL